MFILTEVLFVNREITSGNAGDLTSRIKINKCREKQDLTRPTDSHFARSLMP